MIIHSTVKSMAYPTYVVNQNIHIDHEGPSHLARDVSDSSHEDVMDHDHPRDDEVYGLSNLRRSRRIADVVEKIDQKRWKSNASVHFVDDGEESDIDEEEEEDIEDDEPNGDSDEGLDGYEDDDDEDELFAGPGMEGISLWDSLGEGFLREASQLGMSFWYLYFKF